MNRRTFVGATGLLATTGAAGALATTSAFGSSDSEADGAGETDDPEPTLEPGERKTGVVRTENVRSMVFHASGSSDDVRIETSADRLTPAPDEVRELKRGHMDTNWRWDAETDVDVEVVFDAAASAEPGEYDYTLFLADGFGDTDDAEPWVERYTISITED